MKKLLLASVVALMASSAAFADNTATTPLPVTGSVIAALSLTKTTNITMPTLVAPDAGTPTSVAIACDKTGAISQVTYTGNGNPYAHGTASAGAPNASSANKALGTFAGICGEMAVAGESGYHFQTDTTNLGTSATDAASGLTITSITCRSVSDDSTSTGTLGATGDKLYCGALVTANAAGFTGSYPGTLAGNVTVTYD